MKRTVLVFAIIISIAHMIPASVVINSDEIGGKATANLLLVMNEVKKDVIHRAMSNFKCLRIRTPLRWLDESALILDHFGALR